MLLLAGSAGEAASARTPGAPPALEYLHIEANEDAASGGHAALRLGERVYHFERAEGGWLRLARVDWERFSFRYRVAMNRSLHAVPIEARAKQRAAVAKALEARLHAETRAFGRFRELRADLRVLESLRLAHDTASDGLASVTLPLRGGGFFSLDDAAAAGLRAPRVGVGASAALGEAGARNEEPSADADDGGALGALVGEIESVHGRDFIARRRSELRRAFEANAFDEPGGGGRALELFEAWIALEVLESAAPLRRERLVGLGDAVPPLSAREREQLRARARELRASLVRLIDSRRPDWGRPLLLGAARLAAISATLESGYWRVLDPLHDAEVVFEAGQVARARAALAKLERVQRAHVQAWRARLARRADWSELDAGGFEAALARWAAIDRALVAGADLHGRSGAIVAEGRAEVPLSMLPLASQSLPPADRLEGWTRAAAARVDAARAELDDRYGYDLFARNCATELFAIVEQAAPESALADARLTRDPRGFSPLLARWVASALVEPGISPRTWPSWRREQLAAQYAREAHWKVALRESNVLSSTLHEASPASTTFLFYTDDAGWTRPLRGAVNLAVALGQTVYGVVAAPVDRGMRLLDGLRGAAMSVPELVFLSLRKGSYPFAAPAASSEATGSESAGSEPTGSQSAGSEPAPPVR